MRSINYEDRVYYLKAQLVKETINNMFFKVNRCNRLNHKLFYHNQSNNKRLLEDLTILHLNRIIIFNFIIKIQNLELSVNKDLRVILKVLTVIIINPSNNIVRINYKSN